MSYRNTDKLLKVEVPHINQLYHLSWAARGCVWRLVSLDVEKGTCEMMTPKTRTAISAKISDLRHTRHMQHKIETKQTGYEIHILPSAIICHRDEELKSIIVEPIK